MSVPRLSYTGIDVLETLEGATNYNSLLLDLILENSQGRSRMLDFGAGTGTFAKLLRTKGIDVVCVEPDTRLRPAHCQPGKTGRAVRVFQPGGKTRDRARPARAEPHRGHCLESFEEASWRPPVPVTASGRCFAAAEVFTKTYSSGSILSSPTRIANERALPALSKEKTG